MLKLERIFYPEIHSSVNIQEEGSMEIENRFSLNVNFDNKNQAIEQNQVGKDVIGISAVSLKSFFAWTQYCNTILML